MKINLRITYADGSAADVAAVTADLVAFEDEKDRSVARLDDELKYGDVCWLAWHAEFRGGRTPLEFDPWLDALGEGGVSLADAEVEPVPLGSTAPTSE